LSYQNFIISIIENAVQTSLAAISARLLAGALYFLSSAARAATPALAKIIPQQATQERTHWRISLSLVYVHLT
jgi:hypothetical protein